MVFFCFEFLSFAEETAASQSQRLSERSEENPNLEVREEELEAAGKRRAGRRKDEDEMSEGFWSGWSDGLVHFFIPSVKDSSDDSLK